MKLKKTLQPEVPEVRSRDATRALVHFCELFRSCAQSYENTVRTAWY
jgi:hypothetical protein